MFLPQTIVAGLLLACCLSGQNPPPPGCNSAVQKAFDFWVGDWEVFTPAGALAGTNRIERLLEGCLLQENWQGSQGGAGKSMNFYDLKSKKWRQLWLDDRGQPIEFIGDAFDKGIRFAEAPSTGGTRRMVFTLLDNGDVEQLIEQSKDGGKTHAIVFKGIYKRKK